MGILLGYLSTCSEIFVPDNNIIQKVSGVQKYADLIYGWSLVKCHVMYAMNADALSNNKLIDHDIYHIPYFFFLHTVSMLRAELDTIVHRHHKRPNISSKYCSTMI